MQTAPLPDSNHMCYRLLTGGWLICCVFMLTGLTCCYAADTSQPEAVGPSPSRLTIERIYSDNEFTGKSFSANWLPSSADSPATFTTLENAKSGKAGKDIVRHDPDGKSVVMVAASELTPAGESVPLTVDGYQWSIDLNLVLIYTNSKRVWRNNTRGDYWLYDRSSRQLRKLGGVGPESTMMFAKLSPTGEQVAFVRERNIFIEDLRDHSLRQLTVADSDAVINGTTDWVYEEELGLRDAFQWSSDGKSIAYWQLDTTDVPKFPLINNTDSLYPTVTWYAYPKVGQRNSKCRVGLVDCKTGETQWIDLPGDPREHYLPRMMFIPTAAEKQADGQRLLIQQLNRLQNTNCLLVAEEKGVASVMTETDAAWVDVHDELFWFKDGQHFTWISDRDGWRHVYVVSLQSGEARLVTPGEFDVVELLQVDERGGWLYFIASPETATQRYLYRVNLDGSELVRVTPEGPSATHEYSISPDGQSAIHTYSAADQPPVIDLVSLPAHAVVRTLEDNAELAEKFSALDHHPASSFRSILETVSCLMVGAFFRRTLNQKPSIRCWFMSTVNRLDRRSSIVGEVILNCGI